MQGLIGKKIGMTRIFNKETGTVIPITIVSVGQNQVQQIKTVESDGYSAVQLGYGTKKPSKVSKPESGHFKKHNSEATLITKEFLPEPDENVECGQKIGIEIFNGCKYVNVTGTTKGRGFAGTVKRHGFHIGRMTHGNANKRERGSVGASTYPARVFPGLKMAGHYGNGSVTIKGLQIVNSDKDQGLLYLKGSIPGATKSIVFIYKNFKQ
jgi:large subunit ribosomal protein L3